MDRTLVSGTEDLGSTPSGSAKTYNNITIQGIYKKTCRFSKASIFVLSFCFHLVFLYEWKLISTKYPFHSMYKTT